ncbi:hypothetical protein Hanom_Chr12g01068421 [Helianthus anomalus]
MSGSLLASSPVVNVSSSVFGIGFQSQKMNGLEEGEVLPDNNEESYVGVIPMQKAALDINEKVIEAHGDSENVGFQDMEGDRQSPGVDAGPNRDFNSFLSRDSFNKVWEDGGAENLTFNNGIGPNSLKSVGPPKKTRSHKKKSGINGPTHVFSGAKSGEPVTKKRRRSEEQWDFPLGNMDKSGMVDKEPFFSRNGALEKSLDLNMDAQAESANPIGGDGSSVVADSPVVDSDPMAVLGCS